MPYFEPYINQLNDMLEMFRDLLADLEDEDDTNREALSEFYDAETSLENGIAELKK